MTAQALMGREMGATTVETVGRSFKKSKMELPYDPAIPILSIYLKETKSISQKDVCPSCSRQHYLCYA